MAIGDSLPIMNQIVSNRVTQGYGQQNPNKTTLTLEQQYSQLAQQMQQQQAQPYQQQPSDPYTEGSVILSQCSALVKNKIQNDERFRQIDNEFENLVQQYIFANIIPQIIQNQQDPRGKIIAEKWCNAIKQLSIEFSNEELNRAKTTDMLLNDPVVLARLQELQNNQQEKQVKQPKKQSQSQNMTSIEFGGAE